jgi:succinate dehydrogenase flavin-adding protein (antitoxin of CptAB toxin-antitoxin module)
MVEMMPETPESRQLQWKRLLLNCRRGNAEVEHLLSAYCQGLNPEEPAQAAQLPILEALLAEDDQTLFEWLLQPDSEGADAPDAFTPLIEAIRAGYLST